MWVYPSRGRPTACADLLYSMLSRGSRAPGVVVLSATDPLLDQYLALELPDNWRRQTVSIDGVDTAEKLRRAFATFPNEPWYGWLADDVAVESDGFEQRLVATAGSWNIAGANDGWLVREDVRKTRILSGVTVFGGELVRAVGGLVPEGFVHLYMDDCWESIARELGNWYALMDVSTPNCHPDKVGGAVHPVTAAANAPTVYAADGARFKEWARKEAPEVVERARSAMWADQGLSLARAQARSVMLAFPVYDKPHPEHEAAAMETVGLLARLGIAHGYCHVVGQPTHTARNLLVQAFLKSEFTDILFVDSDMSWRPWDVVRLLAQRHGFIGGVGRKRNMLVNTDPGAWCFKPLSKAPAHDAAGSFEVEHVGTGFLLLNRLVFEAIEQYGTPRKVADADGVVYTQFFRWGYENGSEIGEDYQFCLDYRKIGGKVMVDPSVELSHYGASEQRARLTALL